MQDDSHLIEIQTASERVFDGALLHINRDTVRLPDGGSATREYVVHPGAVMIIPVLPNGKLLMERQFRFPLNRVFIEFPAGKLDPNEDPLECGRRELLEETGYTASEWQYLGVIHPLISYSSEEIQVYLAKGLVAGEARLDEGEFLELIEMSLDELKAAVLDGRVTDGKTTTGIFWADQLLAKSQR
ncbi:ADP-ribose pyrophosphatase [Andreprevotia lacus DSM 23236]|jgi:ADP-ribose pyrophosphatase|uniref:GDP-mannose pyrophosphatase n=1 Tax=Andreprevotia lacus DSM 23236 TaxID=1121001 RepID=A0A1W1X788_9NEIS|nr:NUDIX hydrolase [Andreprevotia lacus]SMC19829.1 ADP-ribose pyrophosphatase [Andreprevotia lacus DSM 23236]